LIHEPRWLARPFIIRLAVKVRVIGGRRTGLLSGHPLRRGQRVDLGIRALGQGCA
jgi:hypothetical protein